MNKSLFIAVFLFFSIAIISYFDYKKSDAINHHLADKTKQISLSYDMLYREYSNLSHLIFDTQINTKDMIDIFKDAYMADVDKKNIIRNKLYLKLKDNYELLKVYNIRQLHFHLPNNESFLRFHRPKKYGDNLSKIRPTIVYVNKHKIEVNGFEEGRIFNGYRFVYPLFNENKKHIGSVEVSFSAKMIVKEIIEHLKLPSNFLISKSVVNKKVFDSEKSNYIPSIFEDYYLDKEIFNSLKEKFSITKHLPMSEASKKLFYKNIEKKEPFSIYDAKSSNIITFIPITNPITKKVIGAISVRNSGTYIEKRSVESYLLSILLIILTAVILYIVYRESRFKNELKLNNKKLQTVIDEADSGIGVMDLNGNFLEVNQVYSDLLGYSKEELLKLSCIKLTKYEDKDLSSNILTKAYRDGKISKAKKTCARKDGSDIYLELSLTLLPSKKAFAAVINSLEETKQLEELNKKLIVKQQEVEKQKEAFETLYEKSSDGVLLIENGKFIDCNMSIVKMTGYNSKDELLNIHLSELSPEFQADGESSFEKANRMMEIAFTQGSHSFEWIHTKASGEDFWVEVVLTHIIMKDKDIIHVVWRDISQRKELESQLQMLNKSLSVRVKEEVLKNREKDKTMLHQSRLAQMGELISMIAHQWRQPLSAISATIADLGMKIMFNNYEKDFFKEKLKNISEYSQHLSKTIDDFRDFYKSNKEKRSIMIEDVFNGALNIIEVSMKNKNIEIKKEFECSDTIETYPNELKQVILNLIKNAEDALLEKEVLNPSITLKTFKDDDYVYLTVSDNAGGIAAGIIENIFEPYFTTKEKRDGTGLGLYMSKTIIEEHCRGLLEVKNSNSGAVFSIKIPLNSKDEQ
ncbi:MAG: PAS domain S-box protein [Campylobacterota bacterium]|nr:PAS domain S-box protein [Campylobacterota bacterium]